MFTVEQRAALREHAVSQPLAIIGVPTSAGAFAPGQEQAPAALREAGRNEGVSYEQAIAALHALLADPTLSGLTITELNPDHTEDDNTVRRFTKAIVDGLAQAPTLA